MPTSPMGIILTGNIHCHRMKIPLLRNKVAQCMNCVCSQFLWCHWDTIHDRDLGKTERPCAKIYAARCQWCCHENIHSPNAWDEHLANGSTSGRRGINTPAVFTWRESANLLNSSLKFLISSWRMSVRCKWLSKSVSYLYCDQLTSRIVQASFSTLAAPVFTTILTVYDKHQLEKDE